MTYHKMFEKTKLKGLTLENRFVMAPMTTRTSMDGHVDEKMVDYYAARAKGGVGFLILESQVVSNKIDPAFAPAEITGTKEQLNEWKNFNAQIRPYGTKTCVQLTVGAGRTIPSPNVVSASAVPAYGAPEILCRPLTIEEIHLAVESFGKAAAMAKESGFDAVEIHGHTGYLMDQFMSACWNQREDEYGGSFENRMRFPREVIASTRKAVGEDYPILFRLSLDHKFEGGRTKEDGLAIIKELEKAGIDAFDIDKGCYESVEWIFPPAYYGDACMLESAAAVKQVTDKPVMVTGNFTPETANQAIENHQADYIMFGRGLVADPELVNKLKEDREDEIRPCLRCNEFCVGNEFAGKALSCAVNMQAGNEKEYALVKAEIPKKVAVVGGGVAGMEAARVATLAGHDVTLYEKDDVLGGQVIAAATPVFKKQLNSYMKYLINQMKKLNVKVVLGASINADSKELLDAEEIVVAVGADPIIPKIAGIDNENVIEIIEAHKRGIASIGDRVVIAGGGLSGCDYALELAMEGKEVTIVEMLDEVAGKAFMINRVALLKKLAEYRVNILTGYKVKEFKNDCVIVEDKGGNEKSLACDHAIVAIGTKSRSDLAKSIKEKYENVKIIGDCMEVGQVGDAVRAAYVTANAL